MKSTIFPKDFSGLHIHFVGIKGTGVSALVEILYARGAYITGSDVSEVFYTDEILKKYGITALEFSKKNITKDISLVIYSSAYNPDTNLDLIAAKDLHIPCMLYTEALGELSKQSYSIGICGVHGKTSTTGLVGSVLSKLQIPFQVLAGSVISSFNDSCTFTSSQFNINNKQNYFIAETCEYQNHFLSFCPKKIILTSVESDHQDFFPTYESICEAFISYICKLPKNCMLIYCADDSGAKEVASRAKKQRDDIVLVPYGENALNSYKVNFKDIKEGKNTFEVSPLGNFFVSVPGKHIALDAVAAITLATELLKEEGQNAKDYLFNIQEGLSSFQGGKRRSEVLGKVSVNKNSVIFIDDYAHHPTAIKKTLAGYREFYKGYKIILDFMSHTYTRTQALLEDFSKSFENADVLILHKIYASARENINEHKISGKTLFEKSKEHHNNVYYFEEVMDAKDFAIEEFSKKLESNYPNGILFVTMGAGDNWKLGQALYNELSR